LDRRAEEDAERRRLHALELCPRVDEQLSHGNGTHDVENRREGDEVVLVGLFACVAVELDLRRKNEVKKQRLEPNIV
jgi:hypothetical protein